MTPFQCDLCHFRNLQQRDPQTHSVVDSELLGFIRRVNLDAFWARETSSVSNNLRLLRRVHQTENRFNLRSFMPPLGPFPLADSLGVGPALAVLDKSLDSGRYQPHVQWATFRKIRSALTNLGQASVGGLTDVVGAHERSRVWISSVSTHTFFFSRFMGGLHRRVGEIVKRDEPVTAAVLHALDQILEARWKLGHDDLSAQLRISQMGLWFLGGFCTGLRGEEMLLLELAGTLNSFRFIQLPPPGLPPHFDFVVAGPTKGNRLSGAKFSIHCVATTSGTGLKPGKWARRYGLCLRSSGATKGALFFRKLAYPGLHEFEDDFMSILETVQQQHPSLIEPNLDVRDAYGIFRSLRRGVTSHALNQHVDPKLIQAVNRWRSERNSMVPNMDLTAVYSRLDTLKPLILEYSDAL